MRPFPEATAARYASNLNNTASHSALRILLDTNVWRYLFDSGKHGDLYRIAQKSKVRVAISPTIVLETLRMRDLVLRKGIIELQTRACWERLMPDAYQECEELKGEIFRCRPHWALQTKEIARLRRLRYDWVRANGGFWSKVRTETDGVASQYASRDFDDLTTAQEQSREVRESVRQGQTIVVGKTLSDIPGSWTTSDGRKVEMEFWRVYASAVWGTVLSRKSPFRQWLSCEIDVNFLLTYYAQEYADFWEKDVQASSVPRAWIRAAMFALQSERRTTDGTPVDAAIAVHLADVDVIVSADKNFVAMANRCSNEAPSRLGRALLIRGGAIGIAELLEFVVAAEQNSSPSATNSEESHG